MDGWRAPDRGALFVLSGPSGVGKSSVIERAMAQVPDLGFSVSATTRAARAGEREGEHYHFVHADHFADRVAAGAFLEHATVYDRRYGTLRAPTEAALAAGRSLLLDIDVQGAAQVRAAMPEAVTIFLAPPKVDVLQERLRNRGTDSEETIRRRMTQVAVQLREIGSFDYVLVNDVLETTQRVFESILLAELHQRSRRQSVVSEMLGQV
ncbi:MAG: guanylate kinase [Deltaproteobacteria bacterium]|nr:guanylate kinase [Deltaproteobacteria bacterium]